MSYPLDDDELVKVAYTIPDLQVSDLQKDGPFYLPKESDNTRPKYIQSQTKFKSFYKVKASVRYFLTIHRKFEKISLSQVFEDWKKKTLFEEIEKKDFLLAEKLERAWRVIGLVCCRKVRKAVSLWKVEGVKWKMDKEAKKQVRELEQEKNELVREKEGLKKQLKIVEDKFKNYSQTRKELDVLRGSSKEGLLNLRRENSLLILKLDNAGKVFNNYLQQIQSLLNNS